MTTKLNAAIRLNAASSTLDRASSDSMAADFVSSIKEVLPEGFKLQKKIGAGPSVFVYSGSDAVTTAKTLMVLVKSLQKIGVVANGKFVKGKAAKGRSILIKTIFSNSSSADSNSFIRVEAKANVWKKDAEK